MRRFLLALLLAACGSVEAAPKPPLASPARLHLPALDVLDFSTTAGVPLTKVLSNPQPGYGFVEIVLTPTGTMPDTQLAWSDPSSDPGSITIYGSGAAGSIQAILSVTGSVDSTQGARLDTQKFWVYTPTPRRTQVMWTWGPSAAGNSTIAVIQNGVIDRPSQISDFGYGTFARPATISTWQLAKDFTATTFDNATINRISLGRARVTGQMAREMARTAGVLPRVIVIGAGDSLTDSQVLSNGWTARLNTLMGVGPRRVVVGNHGVSGDTVAQLLARVEAIVDNAPDYVVVLVGTNNIFRDGQAFSAIQSTYEDLFARLKASGARVIACTVPPLNQAKADVSWPGWYSAGKETQRGLANTWLKGPPANVYATVDLDTVLETSPGVLNTAYTTDGVHLLAAGHVAVGGAVHALGFASAVY